jgi:hypothetical protein
VAEFMALSTLGEDRRVAEANKLTPFSEHPDTFFPGLFGYFAGVVHIGKYHRSIFPKVVGGAGVMRHLGNWNVSEDSISPHLVYEGIRAGDVLLVIGCTDMSKLCPHPVAGRNDGPNFKMFQEDVLELNDLFMGNVPCCGEIEVSISFLVALLVELGDPPAANQNDGVLCELFDFCACCQDKKGGGKGSDGFLFSLVLRAAVTNYCDDSLVGGGSICWASLRAALRGAVLCLSDLCRFTPYLLASCNCGIVEVDYPSAVVWLRLDLDPFRCFGLCGLGRR